MDISEISTGGGIFSNVNSTETNAGSAGNIEIEADQIFLMDGQISSNTHGSGSAGHINLKVADTLTISGGENLEFSVGVITNSGNQRANAGEAGNISIQANIIKLLERGFITTDAKNAGGGNINITTPHLLYLQGGTITSSVAGGKSDGGNISISHPIFVVLNQGQIKAQADEGRGGNIHIISDQFIKTYNSFVSASSQLGIDGNVQIDSPTENVSNSLLSLGKDFIGQVQIKDACKAMIAGQLPTEFRPTLSFKVNKVNMYHFPNDFIEDWIPSGAASLRASACN
jgi:hypothetical protein